MLFLLFFFTFLRLLFPSFLLVNNIWIRAFIPAFSRRRSWFTSTFLIARFFGSILFFKEKIDLFKTFFLMVGFLFTILIIRPDLKVELGSILAVVSAITHAVAGLLVKRLSNDENVLTLMFSMVVLMAPITFIPSVYVWDEVDSFFILALLFSLAVIATLGNYFWTKAISLSKLTNLMPFDFTKLIFSTILGFFFFQEKIDLITSICGIGLIVCNSFIAGKIKDEKA